MPSSNAAPIADPKARAALVLAILNGSTSELDASQRHGIPVEVVQGWRQAFVDAGANALGARPARSKVWRRLNDASRATRRSELDDFERYTLIPGIRGQLEGIREMFLRVLERAQDPQTREQLAFPLSKIANVPGSNPDEMSKHYFAEVVKQCQQDFIAPLDEMMKSADVIGDVPGLMLWAVRVRTTCSSVTRNKDLLFVQLRQVAVSARDSTGKIVVAPPVELSLVVMPFDAYAREAARIAEAIEQSIKTWSESLLTARDRLMTFWSSHENLRGNRYLVGAQFLTLLLSLVAVVLGFAGGDLWNLAKQNRVLTTQLASVVAERDACRAVVPTTPAPGPTPGREQGAVPHATTPERKR